LSSSLFPRYVEGVKDTVADGDWSMFKPFAFAKPIKGATAILPADPSEPFLPCLDIIPLDLLLLPTQPIHPQLLKA